jgi:hypothetical protein
VVATPSAGTFQDWWCPLFDQREVVLLYDNDHPRQHNGKVIEGAGLVGSKVAAGRLSSGEGSPRSVSYLRWGPQGYDPGLPNRYDVRDVLKSVKGTGFARVEALSGVLAKVEPVPKEWMLETELLSCTSWDQVVNSARKALRWNEGLDRGLSVMLAAVTSVQSVGDQLWVKIVSPASGGKSTLCEALSTNKDHVKAVSSLRGFHSGYKTDKEGENDHSLIAELKAMSGGRGCALVTKDGDTLLQSPNLSQILSEARDIYDRTSRAHYRHGLARAYEGVNMTWILCGTASLRQLDHSELGERFLDCVLIDEVDEDEEWTTALRKVYTAHRELSILADGTLDSRDNPEMVKFKRLVGGYIDHLWDTSRDQIAGLELTEDRAEQCVAYGTFVAYMRARPSEKQKEKAEREMSYRLSSQMLRLASCLAVVLNKRELDDEVMRRVRRVALDTARGRTYQICKELFRSGPGGCEVRALAYLINETDAKTRELLKFLKDIRAAEAFKHQVSPHVQGSPRWRLTSRVRALWERVVGNAT